MSRAVINFGKRRETVCFEAPCLLSDLIKKVSGAFEMPCGGKGSCRKCKVRVCGDVSQKDGEYCLACQTYAFGDVKIFLESETYKIANVGNKLSDEYGFAADIGTTTLEASLIDLKTGSTAARVKTLNPQVSFGADVVSRITACIDGKSEALRESIIYALNNSLEILCDKAQISPEKIKKAVISANTAEMCFLTNTDTSSVAAYPFKTDDFFGREDESLKSVLKCKNAEIFLTRVISPFIGGDISSGLYYCGFIDDFIGKRKIKKLFVDIGTNGETVLLNGGKLVCTSAAAGPVFEGTGISQGMLAKSGAIDSVELNGFKMDFTVIGNTEALGICGSGIIDALAAMLEAGVIDADGEILEDGHSFEDNLTFSDGMLGFELGGVVITQEDVRQLQLAKSAVCTAVETLLHTENVLAEEIESVIIAGNFGKHLNFDSAEKIGLLPKGLKDKTEFAGNTSLSGAEKMLLHGEKETVERACIGAETCILAENEYFTKKFIENMRFGY